jgi:hypothetical protein
MDRLIHPIFLYFIFIFFIYNQSLLQNNPNTFALLSSQPFERQEINDMKTNDWTFYKQGSNPTYSVSRDYICMSNRTDTYWVYKSCQK